MCLIQLVNDTLDTGIYLRDAPVLLQHFQSSIVYVNFGKMLTECRLNWYMLESLGSNNS